MTPREIYLQKYVSSNSDYATGDTATAVKKKKKVKSTGLPSDNSSRVTVKKNALTGAAGLSIIDDDIDWTKPAGATGDIDDHIRSASSRVRSTLTDMEDFSDAAAVPYVQIERTDGSGWATVAQKDVSHPSASSASTRDRDGDIEMRKSEADSLPTARRRARHDSPQRDSSPPRRQRHDSPDNSPPRRRERHDSPSPSRAASSSAADASPPRRRRHDSPDNSPPRRTRHDSPDRSPPRRVRHDSPDASPPRRRRHDSPSSSSPRRHHHRRDRHDNNDSPHDSHPTRRHDSPSPRRDSSPPRRKREREDQPSPSRDSSPPRKRERHDSPEREAAAIESTTTTSAAAAPAPQKKGLIMAADFKARNAEAAEKARLDLERIAALGANTGDATSSSATIVRDKSGRKMTVEQYEAQLAAERESKQAKPMEWSGGLAQKATAAAFEAELSASRTAAFARTADDAHLNASQMAEERFDDPMLALKRKKARETAADELASAHKSQKKVIRSQLKAERKAIKKEQKELKHDRKKLLKKLLKKQGSVKTENEPLNETSAASAAASSSSSSSSATSRAETEALVDELLANKMQAIKDKKQQLKMKKEQIKAEIALNIQTGGTGIIVSAADLAAASGSPLASGAVIREPRPMYTRGAPWPNRYGIRSGYRWDGVERGNGWEEKRIRFEMERQNKATRAYKWGSEDM